MSEGNFPPIESYAAIGDGTTMALVGRDGGIEFLCYPGFSDPSVFTALLDRERGGVFLLAPEGGGVGAPAYVPDTNVLVTRFTSAGREAQLTDALVEGRLVRRIIAVRGEVAVAVRCEPRFGYGLRQAVVTLEEGGVCFTDSKGAAPPLRLWLDRPVVVDGASCVACFTLGEGEATCVVLASATLPPVDAVVLLNTAVASWRAWCARGHQPTRWREPVARSALVLKLMIVETTGAIVAAPTFGLPEVIGGTRNWDYRFTWIRDASLAAIALARLGHRDELDRFVDWLFARALVRADGALDVLYPLDPSGDVAERDLDHLEGYRGSRPVRIGNGASHQLQLDIYGEALEAILVAHEGGRTLSDADWAAIVRTMAYLEARWHEPDEGIWEVRGGRKPFLHSRAMVWVAFDRAIRLAQAGGHPAPAQWQGLRTTVRASIDAEFWDPARRAYTQYAGAATLDASALLMPLVGIVEPTAPRWLATLDRIGEELCEGPLVRRYVADGSDGLVGEEGTFVACSFWYVECLARAGRVAAARGRFEALLAMASPTGLFAEELAPDGAHLGNTPQGFSHLALISAALALDAAAAR